MTGSLLLLSTAFAQNETSVLAKLPVRERPQSWTRFTSHTDKFDVLLPARPTLKQESLVISGHQLLFSYYSARRGESDYAVLTLAGLNDSNWRVAHMLMLDLYCRSSSSFKAVFKNNISLAGYAGRQFSLESDERAGEWRIYEVDQTFLAVAGSSNSDSKESLRIFFDSLSLPGKTSSTANIAAEETNSNRTDRWLVILQTFSRHERGKANRRMNLLRGEGFDARVLSTDSYSNLRPGLLVLAMGPFSKRDAERRLVELRSVAPRSYIKAGW